MASVPNVWCVGTAKFVREVSPLIDQQVRVRWMADQAALERNLNHVAECNTVIVEHTGSTLALTHLEFIKAKSPRTRRLVVVDACELKTLRVYLETALASEMIYRPIDSVGLLKSCGVVPPAQRAASPAGSDRATLSTPADRAATR